MSTRILRSYSKLLTINDKVVNESNPTEISLFNDREEVYTYITTLTSSSKENLLNLYRDLVDKYKVSLEYTADDGWVYLIEKCPHDKPLIAHDLPSRPLYNTNDPIKFFKDLKESEETAQSNPFNTLFTAEWYSYFKCVYNRLTYYYSFYRIPHSINYILMEAFILTFGKWFGGAKENFNYSYFSTFHYLLIEKEYLPHEIADLYSYGEEFIPNPSAELYVKATQEGNVFNLPNGEFYNFLPKPQLIYLYNFFLQRGRIMEESL